MGLDMYLNKKTFVWSSDRESLNISYKNVKSKRVSEITEEVMYWRKANAIHSWFVKNVQDNNDDCGDYYVSKEQLQELLDTINKVLESSSLIPGKVVNGQKMTEKGWEDIIVDGKTVANDSVAKKLLPTSEGFFFGGTNYDQYYWEDLVRTSKELSELLKEDGGDFYYHSSW